MLKIPWIRATIIPILQMRTLKLRETKELPKVMKQKRAQIFKPRQSASEHKLSATMLPCKTVVRSGNKSEREVTMNHNLPRTFRQVKEKHKFYLKTNTQIDCKFKCLTEDFFFSSSPKYHDGDFCLFALENKFKWQDLFLVVILEISLHTLYQMRIAVPWESLWGNDCTIVPVHAVCLPWDFLWAFL